MFFQAKSLEEIEDLLQTKENSTAAEEKQLKHQASQMEKQITSHQQ